MLTHKQEMFCQCIASGMDGITSYLTAYNSNNRNVANVESTKLMKRDDITNRIQELYKPISNHNQNAVISERKKQIEYIKTRIALCEQNNDEQSIIRYTDMLNKILSLYKDSEQTQEQQNNLTSVDNDTLKKLAAIDQ